MLNLQQRFVDQMNLDDYQGQLVRVDYCCGTSLAKASGVLNLIGRDFIELVKSDSAPVYIQIYLPGVDPAANAITQQHSRLTILLKQICSVGA